MKISVFLHERMILVSDIIHCIIKNSQYLINKSFQKKSNSLQFNNILKTPYSFGTKKGLTGPYAFAETIR